MAVAAAGKRFRETMVRKGEEMRERIMVVAGEMRSRARECY